MTTGTWTHKDLLGIQELSADEIHYLLDAAAACKEVGERTVKKVPSLRGKTMVNLFIAPSTRTRTPPWRAWDASPRPPGRWTRPSGSRS